MTGLTADALDLAALLAAVHDPEHGGVTSFLGCIRREDAIRPVVAIEYQAYEELTERELAAVAAEAASRFGATVACVHRTGRVEVGEPSVAVAVSAPHRPAAFSACRYVIDELKVRAPIWKRMHYADGATEWIDGRDRVVDGRPA
jgi:molybdopterin synthase catalytic subunit